MQQVNKVRHVQGDTTVRVEYPAGYMSDTQRTKMENTISNLCDALGYERLYVAETPSGIIYAVDFLAYECGTNFILTLSAKCSEKFTPK